MNCAATCPNSRAAVERASGRAGGPRPAARDCSGAQRSARPTEAAFTMVEVLAALLFLGIVIPVAVQGLQIASRAGEVAQRKAEAARVAERILNESIVTTNWGQASQSGTAFEGVREFRWSLRTDQWVQGTTNQVLPGQSGSGHVNTAQPLVNQLTANQLSMDLLTVEVTYPVQGRDYSVTLSTLVPMP